MSSSAVKAQEKANEANLQIAKETNETNQAIADAQNELNYKMFNEQNDWNLKRRDEEWEYNSPSAQMERYIEAGINPLWAMSKGDAGQAQQLTSASPQAAAGYTAVGATMQPAYDTQLGEKVSGILGAAQNIMNDGQGFMKLALEQQDVQTRKLAQQNLARLQTAEVAYKKALTLGQDIFNNLNTETFETQVSTKVQEYNNLVKQGELTDLQKANASATKEQIIAMTNYTNTQAHSLIEQTLQGWKKLAIDQQNANTNQMNAQTAAFDAHSRSYYQGEDLKLRNRQYQSDVSFRVADLEQRSTDSLIKLYEENKGWLEKNLTGNIGLIIDKFTPGSEVNSSDPNSVLGRFETISNIGQVLHQRVIDNPTLSNVQSYQDYLNGLKSLPQVPPVPRIPQNASTYSILNPAIPWQQ